jgi:hypothetical protein
MAGNSESLDLEKKIDLLLEQQNATQRAIAHLKADLTEIVREAVKSAINRHQVEGYSKIAGGR